MSISPVASSLLSGSFSEKLTNKNASDSVASEENKGPFEPLSSEIEGEIDVKNNPLFTLMVEKPKGSVDSTYKNIDTILNEMDVILKENLKQSIDSFSVCLKKSIEAMLTGLIENCLFLNVKKHNDFLLKVTELCQCIFLKNNKNKILDEIAKKMEGYHKDIDGYFKKKMDSQECDVNSMSFDKANVKKNRCLILWEIRICIVNIYYYYGDAKLAENWISQGTFDEGDCGTKLSDLKCAFVDSLMKKNEVLFNLHQVDKVADHVKRSELLKNPEYKKKYDYLTEETGAFRKSFSDLLTKLKDALKECLPTESMGLLEWMYRKHIAIRGLVMHFFTPLKFFLEASEELIFIDCLKSNFEITLKKAGVNLEESVCLTRDDFKAMKFTLDSFNLDENFAISLSIALKEGQSQRKRELSEDQKEKFSKQNCMKIVNKWPGSCMELKNCLYNEFIKPRIINFIDAKISDADKCLFTTIPVFFKEALDVFEIFSDNKGHGSIQNVEEFLKELQEQYDTLKSASCSGTVSPISQPVDFRVIDDKYSVLACYYLEELQMEVIKKFLCITDSEANKK